MTRALLAWVRGRLYELNTSALESEIEEKFREKRGEHRAYLGLLRWIEAEELRILNGREEEDTNV